MGVAPADHAARVVAFIQNNKPQNGDVSLNDVMQLAETMTSSYSEFFKQLDHTIHSDLAEIAGEIVDMKSEIAKLRVSDMTSHRIPEAGRELDAIVEATESATHRIMAAAESIMAADTEDAEAYQETVSDRVIEIFEACAFQDITGQRIAKVVSTLSHVEERVNALVDSLKLVETNDIQIAETDEERRKRELILHGPQHDGEGVCQDDIDAMLADETDGASQDDIDKLFG